MSISPSRSEYVVETAHSVQTMNIDAPLVPTNSQSTDLSSSQVDLFPRLVSHKVGTNPMSYYSSSSSIQSNELVRVPSIDSGIVDDMIRQHSKDVQFQRELNDVNDRLYFTKLFYGTVPHDGNLTDFAQYNREVEFEMLLRGKILAKMMDRNQMVLKTGTATDLVPGDESILQHGKRRLSIVKFISDNLWKSKGKVATVSDIKFDVGSESVIDKPEVGADDNNLLRHNYTTQRKLKSRHLQMIGFSSTIGVGLFLNSGKLFEIAGPLGCLLGYIIGGVIVLCTMLSFCEMVTLIPLSDGISGVTSRFVDDAFGFSLGICYYISFALGMPTEIVAGTVMLSYYTYLDVPNGASTVGWIFLFLVLIITINLMDVRVYGEFEFFLNVIKISFTLLVIIFLIVSNRGGAGPDHHLLGFKYWNSARSSGELTFGPFRPTFDLKDNGSGSTDGIGGHVGRFLSVITLSLISCYSYTGTEIPCIVAGEVINPRRALKVASKQVFWRIAFFYILSIFLLGINVYSGDPRLLRYMTNQSGLPGGEDLTDNPIINAIGGVKCYDSNKWNMQSNGNQSPWVLLIQYTNNCSLLSVMNGFIVLFAISTSSSHLYVSSRSLYAMAVQGKLPNFLKKCWSNGVPYLSVLTTSLFLFLSFLVLNERDLEIFQVLINLISTAAILSWFGINFAYLRFFYALKLRPDIVSRDSPQYPYKSPLQPYLAFVGLGGSTVILLLMGFVTFLHGCWSTEFFMTSYGMWIIFIGAYVLYKWVRNVKYQKLYNIDLDTGRIDVGEL